MMIKNKMSIIFLYSIKYKPTSSLMDIDTIISEMIKTPEELDNESKHGWIHRSPPLVCFNNCFPKSFAENPSNWIDVYPEYYWLNNKCEKLNIKIEQQLYRNESERKYWLKLIQKYRNEMNKLLPYRPMNDNPLSIASDTLLTPAAAPGPPNAPAIAEPAACA